MLEHRRNRAAVVSFVFALANFHPEMFTSFRYHFFKAFDEFLCDFLFSFIRFIWNLIARMRFGVRVNGLSRTTRMSEWMCCHRGAHSQDTIRRNILNERQPAPVDRAPTNALHTRMKRRRRKKIVGCWDFAAALHTFLFRKFFFHTHIRVEIFVYFIAIFRITFTPKCICFVHKVFSDVINFFNTFQFQGCDIPLYTLFFVKYSFVCCSNYIFISMFRQNETLRFEIVPILHNSAHMVYFWLDAKANTKQNNKKIRCFGIADMTFFGAHTTVCMLCVFTKRETRKK